MSYEKEIKHLMRELKFAKSDYLNARLKSEDALRIHAFKTDVETIEFQIEVFEKATKADEYEAKAKAFDAYHSIISKHIEQQYSHNKHDMVKRFVKIHDDYESGELDAKK